MLIIVNDTNVVYTGDYDYWVLDYKRGKLLGPLNHKELDNFLYFAYSTPNDRPFHSSHDHLFHSSCDHLIVIFV